MAITFFSVLLLLGFFFCWKKKANSLFERKVLMWYAELCATGNCLQRINHLFSDVSRWKKTTMNIINEIQKYIRSKIDGKGNTRVHFCNSEIANGTFSSHENRARQFFFSYSTARYLRIIERT